MTIYSWKTKKTGAHFTWFVKEITPRDTQNESGQYADTVIIKCGTSATRARAKGAAVKWVRYYKQVAA